MATRYANKKAAEEAAAKFGNGHNIAKDTGGHFYVLGPKGDKFVPGVNKEGNITYDPNQHLQNVVAEPTAEQVKEDQEYAEKVLAGIKDGTVGKTLAVKTPKTPKATGTIGYPEMAKQLNITKRYSEEFWLAIFPNHQKRERWAFTPEDVEKIKKALAKEVVGEK